MHIIVSLLFGVVKFYKNCHRLIFKDLKFQQQLVLKNRTSLTQI